MLFFNTGVMTFVRGLIFSFFLILFCVKFFRILLAISFMFEKFIGCGKFNAQILRSRCFELRRGTRIVTAFCTMVAGGICSVL